MSATAFDYERAKGMVQAPDPLIRREVAANPDTPAEILYFLANDESPEVRRAIAGNPSTPRQAGTMLAKDADYGVRCELARKIVGEGLDGDERSELWRMGFTILETLATDTVVQVRRVLAELLKNLGSAPHPIVARLANDPDPEVATPILRLSPVLTEDDLIEIVSGDGPEWAKSAIACRAAVTPRVADAIAANSPDAAVTGLLENRRAEISDPTIERLSERSQEVTAWQKPLVERPSLPGGAVLRLARFISGPLLSALRGRGDLDPDTTEKLSRIADARGDTQTDGDKSKQPSRASGTPGWARGTAAERTARSWESPDDRVLRMHQAGRLTVDAVELALDSGETEFVVAALAIRSRISLPTVRRMIEAKTAKAITALCWKAGLNMRFAVNVQQRLAQIQPANLLYARDGHEYPLTPEDMAAHLDLLTS